MAEDSLGARIRALREEKQLSLDDLAYTARSWAPKISGSYISRLERNEKYPSVATLYAIARGMELDASVFPEYRLGVARQALDERTVGLDRALSTLGALSQALAGSRKPQEALEDFAQALEALGAESEAAPSARGRRTRGRQSR